MASPGTNLGTRLLAVVFGFMVGLTATQISKYLTTEYGEPISRVSSKTPHSDRSAQILNGLLPNGVWADSSKLAQFDRADVVTALKRGQADSTGERALGISFLLAVVREDYANNRNKIVEALAQCRNRPYQEAASCADYLSSYLMELSHMGDTTLLPPLFEISDLADGAFSQSLGTFYSQTLADQPDQFLTALLLYSRERQQRFCESAGWEDGSGMDEERFRRVQLQLISYFLKQQLASVAKNCWEGVENAHKEVLRNR